MPRDSKVKTQEQIQTGLQKEMQLARENHAKLILNHLHSILKLNVYCSIDSNVLNLNYDHFLIQAHEGPSFVVPLEFPNNPQDYLNYYVNTLRDLQEWLTRTVAREMALKHREKLIESVHKKLTLEELQAIGLVADD